MPTTNPYHPALVNPPQMTPSRDHISGDEVPELSLTIATLAPAFLEWGRYEMRRVPSTIMRYREALGWVVRLIGDQPVGRLHLGHIMTIRRRLEERGCREARVAAILHALRSFLTFCREVLHLAVLDPRQVRVPRIPRRAVIYLTPQEVQRYVDAIIGPHERWDAVSHTRLRFRTLVEVLLGTGTRISEVLSLNRSDLRWELKEAKIIGKGHKERTHFFTDRALLWLERYLAQHWDDDDALFVTQGEHPRRLIQRDRIKDTFARYRMKAGLTKRVSPHILRHTMATTLALGLTAYEEMAKEKVLRTFRVASML